VALVTPYANSLDTRRNRLTIPECFSIVEAAQSNEIDPPPTFSGPIGFITAVNKSHSLRIFSPGVTMPHLVRACLLFFVFAIAASPASAQQKLDIIQIMGQFVQASHAASKCLKPDRDTLSHFLVNFKIVTFRASEEMRKKNPGMSEQQVLASFTTARNAVAQQIDDVLATNGCGDPRIQDLLKRFDIQAKLKL
jgi:hypothetical protein